MFKKVENVQFKYTFGLFELLVAGGFALLYVLYFVRLGIIAFRLKSPVYLALIKLVLRAGYVALIVLAILGPHIQEPNLKGEAEVVAKDIYFLVDQSLSMGTRDVRPSRLKRAQNELNKLLKQFPSDNLGIIVFPSTDSVFCPLTYNKQVVSDHINVLEPVSGGTDFFPPLFSALNKHAHNHKTKADAKLIVLISDGEEFGDKTSEVLNDLDDTGIKVFTVGVGTSQGGRIPFRNGFKKDRQGKVVQSKLNRKSLQKLAREANGNYYELGATRNDMDKLVEDIKNIQGASLDKREVEVPLDYKYHYFLYAALILILADILLSIRIFNI